ncbi:MAG: trypsin-like peptidase domain-containing protein [Chloroflexota bacterium]|nr:trypsin-like peptidase domain-containing protein [Chloroflexota bacterium]MDE2885279.1 trypsin-like peptidase domain-containing protein [Chloroflexota bacterium]
MHKLALLLLATLVAGMLAACTSTAAPTPTTTSDGPPPTATPDPLRPLPTPTIDPLQRTADLLTAAYFIADTVERTMPAVVQVIATVEQTNVFGQTTPGVAQGSGVFFHEEGYILTNEHVVEGAVDVEVVLSNRQRLPVDIIGVDKATDLAVLKVDPQEVEDLVTLRLGDVGRLRIGEWVVAIGSPLGFQGSVTVGVLSAKGRSLGTGGERLDNLLQTDAVINPGNSGGPLLNLNGEVVGINTRVIRESLDGAISIDGMGFAISADTATAVSQHLIEFGRVVRPRMGITVQDVTPTAVTERNLTVDEGALVVSVAEDSPAARAGIEVNDVIVQVDGIPITGTSQLVLMLLTDYRVGDTIDVEIVRAAVRFTFELTLEEVNFDDEEEQGGGNEGGDEP